MAAALAPVILQTLTALELYDDTQTQACCFLSTGLGDSFSDSERVELELVVI